MSLIRPPSILSREDCFDVVFFCFLSRQKPGPTCALVHLTAGARAVIFLIPDRFFTSGPVPVEPAFLFYMGAHFAFQKNNMGVIPPGPPEINSIRRTVAGQPAGLEDISEGLRFRSGGGCEISVDRFVPVIANISHW